MYQKQATVAMEQQQIWLDVIGAAEAGACFGTGSTAMSTHRDLIPEHHTSCTRSCKGL